MKKKQPSDTIGVKEMSPENIAKKYADRKRVGKTEKDKGRKKA